MHIIQSKKKKFQKDFMKLCELWVATLELLQLITKSDIFIET